MKTIFYITSLLLVASFLSSCSKDKQDSLSISKKSQPLFFYSGYTEPVVPVAVPIYNPNAVSLGYDVYRWNSQNTFPYTEIYAYDPVNPPSVSPLNGGDDWTGTYEKVEFGGIVGEVCKGTAKDCKIVRDFFTDSEGNQVVVEYMVHATSKVSSTEP